MSSIPAPAGPVVARLGRYRLLLELGHGGMARVYVASSSGLAGFNKLVVLKVMREELSESESSLNMFLAEARLAARMNHPHIVQTLEVGEDAGRYFICMEYLEGQTLGRLLKRTSEQPLPLAARLEFACQMLEALSYMHDFTDPDGTPLGLVHRDLSPNNIFITFEGAVKVLDFGVAKAVGISHATEPGVFKGKLGYAAPEQILGDSEQRSDIFALGVLLWEMLAYRRFSQDRTQQEVMQARMSDADPELMRKTSGVPAELLRICTRAAAKEPEARYANALEMRDAIREYVKKNQLECSPEQLRALMDNLYGEEHAEIRRLIDQRMKQATVEDDASAEQRHAIPAAPTMLGDASTITLTGNVASYAPVAPSTSKHRWIAALIGVACVAGVGGRLLSTVARPELTVPTSGVASRQSIRIPQARVPRAALVTVKIAASPPSAELLLDGARLEGNPFVGEFPKDPALHRLELRCLGRRTEARMIRLDQDVNLLIALQLDDVKPPRGVASAPAKGRMSAANSEHMPGMPASPTSLMADSPLVHTTPAESARPIDDTDPYAN